MLSRTFVSWGDRMSGCCSLIRRSTSAVRARTELMFQEAIFRRLLTRQRLPCRAPQEKGPRSGGMERGPPSVVTQGIPQARVTGGNPKLRDRRLFYSAAPDATMNGSQNETLFIVSFSARRR